MTWRQQRSTPPSGAQRSNPAGLDALVEELTLAAHSEDEQLRAFWRAFEKSVPVPFEGFVIGEPVSVIKFDYDGNERRGLTAKCRRLDGREYMVAAEDVTIAPGTEATRYMDAYRKWVGLIPRPFTSQRNKNRSKAMASTALPQSFELAILSIKQRAARCQVLGSDQIVTLRAGGLRNVAPGEIAVVRPNKQWTYAGSVYLSGEIESTRLEAAALSLVPLGIEDQGLWDPCDHYWGEEDEPIEDWAKPIVARGQRRQFEMEQVLPGADPDDPLSDPIIESTDRKDSGDRAGAYTILMDLCQADLRCLDAHSHLGNLVFDGRPEDAIRHYEAGLRIGELSLGENFDGLLPWNRIDNRPFLRCMSGFGLCLWRLRRFEDAAQLFDRMLWLNPSDNQGARFLLHDIQTGVTWESSSNK